MAKITDPEIIQALKDGILIKRPKDQFPIRFYENLGKWCEIYDMGIRYIILDLGYLEADDWEIVPDELSTT